MVGGEKVSADYLNFEEDYLTLPRGAIRPTSLPSSKLTTSHGLEVKLDQQSPFLYKTKISLNTRTNLTLHVFNFPGWVVKLDQNLIKHQSDANGYITFGLDPGSYQLEIQFKESLVRRIGDIITLGSLLLLTQVLMYYSYKAYAKRRA
jgi:hypothetical protein